MKSFYKFFCMYIGENHWRLGISSLKDSARKITVPLKIFSHPIATREFPTTSATYKNHKINLDQTSKSKRSSLQTKIN